MKSTTRTDLVTVSFYASVTRQMSDIGFYNKETLVCAAAGLPSEAAEVLSRFNTLVTREIPSWLSPGECVADERGWRLVVEAAPADWSEALCRALHENQTMALGAADRVAKWTARYPENPFFASLRAQLEGWLLPGAAPRKFSSPLSLKQSDAGRDAYYTAVAAEMAAAWSKAKASLSTAGIAHLVGVDEHDASYVIERRRDGWLDRGIVSVAHGSDAYVFQAGRYYGRRSRATAK